MRGVAGEALLAQLTALNAGATQHLAVLLLGHALAALLDDRTHSRFPHFRYQYVRNPAGNAWNKTTHGALEAAPRNGETQAYQCRNECSLSYLVACPAPKLTAAPTAVDREGPQWWALSERGVR